MKRVIVSQIGSRRRYLIPRVLENNGILECLYTDSNSDSVFGKFFALLKKIGFETPDSARLLNRKTNLPSNRVYSNDYLQIKLFWHRIIGSPSLKFKQLRFEGSSRWFILHGCRNANVLYNMFIENFDYAMYAKKRGLKIICDFYENPFIYKELANDVRTIPEYSCISDLSKEYIESHQLRMRYLDRMLEISDAYLIPSYHVAEALEQSCAFDPHKVNIIPYVSSIKNCEYRNQPHKGRILWIGNEAVRKGLVYCERAAALLTKDYPYIDFRVIGDINGKLAASNAFSHLHFIGYLNKDGLAEEFQKADMLVFPTLSEGFSGALLEAASYGVPIITTHASGFDEDFPGIFIKERNTEVIVEAVRSLLEDRNKRNHISHAIYDYAQNSSHSSFSQKLLDLINSL